MLHSLLVLGDVGRPGRPENFLHAIQSHCYIRPIIIALEQFPLRVTERDLDHAPYRSTRLLAMPFKLDTKLSLRQLLGFRTISAHIC